jgi:hypothetical protein
MRMGKPSTKGFSRNVYVSGIHGREEVVRQLSETIEEASKLDTKKEISERLIDELKPQITSIVKKAFMQYAAGHTTDVAKQDVEWKRFNRVLKRIL